MYAILEDLKTESNGSVNIDYLSEVLLRYFIIPDSESWRMADDEKSQRVADMATIAKWHFEDGRPHIPHKRFYMALNISRKQWSSVWFDRHRHYLGRMVIMHRALTGKSWAEYTANG